MKQTTKNILHASFHSALFGSVIFVVGTLVQSPKPDFAPSVPAATGAHQSAATPEHKKSSVQLAGANTAKLDRTESSVPERNRITTPVMREYEYRMFAAPDDPGYGGNWSLAKVNALGAWGITTGNGQTVVAVIDSGVALAHEELASQWFVNAGETGTTQSGGRCWTGTPQAKQSNDCDDDDNGYTDDWRGWNFILHDNNPQTGRQNPSGDGIRHGTEVAGIVGARGNNGIGTTALNWNTKIMPLQALSDDGLGYTSGITSAIYYAANNGAHVINLSLGAYANDPAMELAVDYATARGVVVVAASGNCGDSNPSECADIPAGTVAYPAAYPDVIAVGASTSGDQRASFSSYGNALDVVAPGYGVPSSTSWSANNQTSLYSGALYGTSFAAPQVASLAALIKSIRPSSSVADITALINATASKPTVMNGLFYDHGLGHGIINAGTALAITQTLNVSTAVPVLLQAGSYRSEHGTPSDTTLSSGCQVTVGACTIQLTGDAGHTRFLPYAVVSSGSAGWSWASNSLSSDVWEIRARSGDDVSITPYHLIKK